MSFFFQFITVIINCDCLRLLQSLVQSIIWSPCTLRAGDVRVSPARSRDPYARTVIL